jgi:ABC-type branched-subunit amino acid transport system substrate-binding protein
MRSALKCGITVAVALVVAAGAPAFAQQKKPASFKIAGVLALSGAYGIFGEDMKKGVEIALQERQYKINGVPIEVVWEDSETKPQPAVQKATRHIASGVDLVFGGVSSAVSAAIQNLTEQRKVPHLITFSVDDALTKPGGARYSFRTSNNFTMEILMTAEYAKRRGLKKVYGVIPDYEAARRGWDLFQARAKEAGIEIVGVDFPALGNRDFSVIIDKIAKSGADSAFSITTGSDAVTFIKQAGQVGLSKKVALFGPVLQDETLAKAVGPASVGVATAVRYHFTQPGAANAKFVEAFKAKFGDYPSSAAGEAYDGIRWWLDVVEKTGSWDKEVWVKAFEKSVQENSVEGRKAMRACDHQASQVGLWGEVVETNDPKLPKYMVKLSETYPAERLFEPCK